MTKLQLENLAPDTDAIVIRVGNKEWEIDVWRDEDETVHVSVCNLRDGSAQSAILGVE